MTTPIRDPIKLEGVKFEQLHADDTGTVILKLQLPPSECGKAGLLPLMRDLLFDVTLVATEISVKRRDAF